MSDAAEGGASIAWRLLATLEGGTLLLAASALLAYTASSRAARSTWRQPCRTVLLTNTTSELGAELKRRLEVHGCTVRTLTGGATSGATSRAVDALVVVGAKPKSGGLNGISELVTKDIYDNMKLLESLSQCVQRGGSIAWACAGDDAETDAFCGATASFDAVLQASLQHVAKVNKCEPVWVGRCEDAAERVVAALTSPNTQPNTNASSLRTAAIKVGKYLYRWLKTIT